MAPQPWMDERKAPLNACSLETIPEPIVLSNEQKVWPLMLSCYQLEEDGSRRGQMDLHLVSVPDVAGSNQPSLPLSLGTPRSILTPETSSGILDGKWAALPPLPVEDESVNNADQTWAFATAHSTGEIRLHSFEATPFAEYPRLVEQPLYKTKFLGQSMSPSKSNGLVPLCLSLNWDSPASYKRPESGYKRIVSTYSNGKVALHDVSFLPDSVQLVERDSWAAHHIFQTPTEVWSACFCVDFIVTGGDDGRVKFWDERCTTRPVQVLQSHFFDAGVTCVSSHPSMEHILAAGSYDETVSLFDVRYLDNKKPLMRTKKLGGGVWRIKWHPYSTSRMLVAVMHGGCRVLQMMGLNEDGAANESYLGENRDDYSHGEDDVKAKVTKKFEEHESMAYGADWLVCTHPTQDGFFEAAGSCSFYDRAVFLWDTVF